MAKRILDARPAPLAKDQFFQWFSMPWDHVRTVAESAYKHMRAMG